VKIGIIADTHGQVDLALAAAKEFIFRGADAICHCGDIGSDMVMTEMASLFNALDIPVFAILGNSDSERDWHHFPDNMGVTIFGRFGEVDLHGKRIALHHGDDESGLEKLVELQEYDYLFSGHTHESHDRFHGKTRLINPGAAGRGMHPSCAVLDLVADELEYFTIRRSV